MYKAAKEEKEMMNDTTVDDKSMTMEDVSLNDLPTRRDDDDDDDDGDEDCERGHSRQLSCDTASLTLKSSSSEETIAIEIEEEAFGSPGRLRLRQRSFPASSRENEPSHDDHDDKKRFHETTKHYSRRRHNLVNLLLASALVALFCLFSSANTLDRAEKLRAKKWKLPSKQRARKLVHKIERRPLRAGFTVRLKGDRIDLLLQSVDRLARCPSVKDVQIEWDQQNREIPESLLYHKSRKVVPMGKTNTDAVLLLEQSVQLSCEELERAYNEWVLDPVLLVGFLPLRDRDEGSYALLSDHAVFTHTLYLDSIDKTSSLQTKSHCQHLAFSAYVTALTSKSPVAIRSNPGRAAPTKHESGSREKECVKQLTEATGLHSLPEEGMTYVGRLYS
jgi:hypothetical protein